MAKYIVEGTILGTTNQNTGSNHRKGEIVDESEFGSKEILKRFKDLGVIRVFRPEDIEDESVSDLLQAEVDLTAAKDSGNMGDYASALSKVTTGNDQRDNVAAALDSADDKNKAKK